MERWKRGSQEERFPKNPSFSSALLDAIYRSTDDNGGGELFLYRKAATMRERIYKDECSPKRASRIDKWTSHEKKTAAEKLSLRRKASEIGLLDAGQHPPTRRNSITAFSEPDSVLLPRCRNSSEIDSVSFQRGAKPHYHHPPSVVIPPKNTNTAKSDLLYGRKPEEFEKSTGIRSSSAMATSTKLFNDVKKQKQPISPGTRIANFFSSLFATGKKARFSSSRLPTEPPSPFFPNSGDVTTRSWSSTATTTSTRSSKSCLSKSSAASTARSDGVRRSVRFYPMSVIVGEDSRPCGHKSIDVDGEKTATVAPLMSERVRARARDYDSTPAALVLKLSPRSELFGCHEEEDDDDVASDASSDLFELENLTAVGMRELPVYETTDVHTNHAIAKGLIA